MHYSSEVTADGDRWGTLYRASAPRVYRALVAVLMDRDAALDALQEAFYEGLRRPPPDDRNLEGWLYRVALRKARRSFARPRPVRLTLAPPASGGIDLMLDRLEAGRLLALLTVRQRAIVVAHFYLGLTHEEVARLVGVRRGTVGATIAQSLKRMRAGGGEGA